jgi:hypothetical protein
LRNSWSTTERTKNDQIKSESVKSFRGGVKCELVRLAVKQIELNKKRLTLKAVNRYYLKNTTVLDIK